MQKPLSLHFPLPYQLDHSIPIDNFETITFRVVSVKDRDAVIDVINAVTGERKFLQTDRYHSSPKWEKLLAEGMNVEEGFLLLAIEDRKAMIGFARLYSDDDHSMGRKAGNIGIALLPSYRSMGIGAIILKTLVGCATELDYVVLTANILETNIRSRRLFSRCGFKQLESHSIFLDFLNGNVNEFYYEAGLLHRREAIEDEL